MSTKTIEVKTASEIKGFRIYTAVGTFGPYYYSDGFDIGESGIVYQKVQVGELGPITNKVVIVIKCHSVMEYLY